jgi:hypothetical protein
MPQQLQPYFLPATLKQGLVAFFFQFPQSPDQIAAILGSLADLSAYSSSRHLYPFGNHEDEELKHIL